MNEWALSGDWTVTKEATTLNKANGRIGYCFQARDLHLVGPKTPGTPVRFRVLIDGQTPGAAHGSDIDEQGNGTVTQQRLHQLIRQQTPIADRQFEIEFLDPDVTTRRHAQCGYCQSSQIMSAAALLANNPHPSDSEIDDAMSGNICR